MKAELAYRRPWKQGRETRIVRESASHVDGLEHSIDIALPEGEDVLAAADGVVAYVKDDSYDGGDDPRYVDDVNMIILSHTNPDRSIIELSWYMHNQGGTARVQVGDEVQAGQVIALSGSTGYVSEPHLHYMITKPGTADTPSQVQTLEVDFVE